MHPEHVIISSSTGAGRIELLIELEMPELNLIFSHFKDLEGLDVLVNENPVEVSATRDGDNFHAILRNVSGLIQISFVDFYR